MKPATTDSSLDPSFLLKLDNKKGNKLFLGIYLASTAYGAQLRLLSYNMYGWNAMGTESWKKENLFKTIRAASPGK